MSVCNQIVQTIVDDLADFSESESVVSSVTSFNSALNEIEYESEYESAAENTYISEDVGCPLLDSDESTFNQDDEAAPPCKEARIRLSKDNSTKIQISPNVITYSNALYWIHLKKENI